MKKRKVLDLFAGCGGLSKGFEQAGFEIHTANEFWKPAQETYVKNHPNTTFIPGDITKEKTKRAIIDSFNSVKCDVIIGGPPCQAYSVAGLRDPNDPRGKLFHDYVELVKKLQPKVFVMENVKGILTIKHKRDDLSKQESEDYKLIEELEQEKKELLLLRKQSKNNSDRFKFTKDDGRKLNEIKSGLRQLNRIRWKFTERVPDKIVKKFSEIGYKVRYKLLNSADFGVPQKRQRVIFIGTKSEVPIKHPKPTHSEISKAGLKKWVSVKEAIDDLRDVPEDYEESHIFTKHNNEFLQKIKNTPIGKSVFGGYSDAFFRNPPNEPSRTVKENHGGVLLHYDKNRVMTPRELARLQSFPDDFIFEGSKSTILKQIGNAVPPGLARAIGLSVNEMLNEIDKKN